MMKNILLLFLLLSLNSFGQTEKEIEKSIKKFKKNHKKGIKLLNKYMGKAEHASLDAWEVLIDMEYIELKESSQNNFGDKNSKHSNVTPSNFIDLCRKSTILSESTYGSFHLRKMMLEVNPDTNLSSEAETFFTNGDNYLKAESYELAKINYRKALLENPNFYSANIQLAVVHWRDGEEIDSSIYYLNQAKKIQPNFLDPYKLSIELFTKKRLTIRAKKECINAMFIYPGFDLKQYFQEVLYEENKYMDEHRLWRNFYPNNMTSKYLQREIPNEFNSYRTAKSIIQKHTNESGIISKNDITDNIYLEVYSWQKMLSTLGEKTPEYLNFAKKMEQEGYLDCYVLVSLFHYDLYPQFKHFMSIETNRQKTKTYIEKYLIKTYQD